MTTFYRAPVAARARQSGFTLIELIGVMALIAILVYAGMKIKRNAEVNTQATTLFDAVVAIQAEVPKVYPGLFTGMTCAILANNSVFSGTAFRVDRSVPATPTVFYNAEPNSQITCSPVSVITAGQNDGYTLTFPALSNEMCNAVADKLNQSAWLISINGTNVKALRGALNTADKGTQCNAAATQDNQTLVATFTRSLPPQ
jgi:prepilin-type N-terminal cleavage/methylation domain-containing protein